MKSGYLAYMFIVSIFTVPIFITPIVAEFSPEFFDFSHDIYSYFCHQKIERSLCYFHQDRSAPACHPRYQHFYCVYTKNHSIGIGDCISSDNAGYAMTIEQERIIKQINAFIGYKFPVCSRDMGIYGAMLFGGILFLLLKKPDDVQTPPFIYFILAILPIAIDGGTQLIGLRESSNFLRILTGFIAGMVVPFYAIPLFNRFIFSSKK